MDHTTLIRRPRLRGPVLLAAFDGWNDAGEAATSALDAIGDGLGAETFATMDPEAFYDFQAARPTVRLVDGHRQIEWPAVELRAARLPAAEHDLIVVRGHEPNLRWRTFASEIVELAADLRVEMMVTVGALLADVPHTRPVQVVSSAGDKDLAERLGLNVSRYEGPTGILGVLGEAAKLSDAERTTVIRGVLAAAGDLPVCVGITHAATDRAIAYAREAAAAGAHSVMLAPPALARPNDDAVLAHYLA
ncbi:MAG TPA: dihydrodipicolinate synthase family protein, partial [Actinomycetota bacterium]|nr:dihydrodipicolinate synthase family protein [Actinomycetota bacterium]